MKTRSGGFGRVVFNVGVADGGVGRYRSRLLEKKDVAGVGMEVRSSVAGKRFDVERGVSKLCRIVDDEGESVEEDFMIYV